MIDYSDYYYEPRFKVNFIEELYCNLQECIEKNTFHISRNNLLRTDVHETLIKNIRADYSEIPISDISIFKNNPKFKYGMHRDRIRKCAINILLSDEDNEFEVLFYNKDFSSKFIIPYKKGIPLLINTQQYHSIKNNSDVKFRYILSLGCTELDYHSVKEILNKKK